MTVGNVGALRAAGPRACDSAVRPAGLVVRRPGGLPPGADRRRRILRRRTPIGSTLAYALMYAAVNLGAFAVAALVARTSARRTASRDYRGLYASSPLTRPRPWPSSCSAWPGLPPGVIGLFAKVTVFAAAVDAGLGWLAVVMAVNVAIALPPPPLLLPPGRLCCSATPDGRGPRRTVPAGALTPRSHFSTAVLAIALSEHPSWSCTSPPPASSRDRSCPPGGTVARAALWLRARAHVRASPGRPTHSRRAHRG